MNRISKGLATAGFLAAMFGGGAIGAVAFGATGGGSSSTTTTTTPTITVAPSTGGTTTTPSRGGDYRVVFIPGCLSSDSTLAHGGGL